MKSLTSISKYISLGSFLVMIFSCFMSWAYYQDVNEYFNGFYSYHNIYGKPGKFLLVFGGISIISAFVDKLIFKRISLLVSGLNVAYAIKNFLLFGSCYRGYCPEKQIGLYLMMISTLIIFIMAFLPSDKKVQ